MAKGIDEIIADVQDYLNDLRLRIEQGSKVIALLRDLKFGSGDGPPRYPGDPGGPVSEQLPILTAPPEVARPENRLEPSRNLKSQKRNNTRQVTGKSSQFKGVTYKKKEGRWYAQSYDRVKKKSVHLGVFDNEYLAAAAYADHTGDKKEAAKLRAMVPEQLKIPTSTPEIVRPEKRIEPSRTIKPQKPERRGGTRRSDSTSRFKGVRRDKRGYADGREKWLVSYYNRLEKKLEYLGAFDNEFLAAAAYAERDGNKQEAARLRALVAEYKDLNPDRPDGQTFKPKRSGKKTIWVCLRCGTEYRSKKPQTDENGLLPCGCHDGTREVPANDF